MNLPKILSRPFVVFSLGAGLFAAACSTDMQRMPVLDGIRSEKVSIFATAGRLCDAYVSFAGLAQSAEETADSAAGTPIALRTELSVCGGASKASAWRAIAAGMTTQLVAINDAEANGKLYLKGNVVSARLPSGETIPVGHLDAAERGNIVTLDSGVSPGILVQGQPFSLTRDRKDSPGKVVQFRVAGHN